MKDRLFPFQEDARDELLSKIRKAHILWQETDPQIISFSAPTGAGKTIILTTLIEDILFGTADVLAEPDSVFVWLSDSPELNEQTRLKMEMKSDKLYVRDLIPIDSSFNAQYLNSGCVYFLNTQKLGSDKLLISHSDSRQYTIWETLTNTARRNPQKMYVIIDEAHRGTAMSAQASNKAQSIMQKFIKGSPEDGLVPMPLVIGVTATPEKFDRLAAGVSSTVQKVIVSPKDVRDSGLLKDRIILHIPEGSISADMTTLRGAVRNWKDKREQWHSYCVSQQGKNLFNPIREVEPILVIQVEDGNDHEATHTDLVQCVDIINTELGKNLKVGEIVHTFNDHGSIPIGNLTIRQIEASRIEEDHYIKVVFFKMNLSTGWDCPRAETMMSFRGAQDSTYIAQLLGRMIRTPLARRIESNASLNDVSLFLPHYDKETAENIIKALRENESVYPGEIGTDKSFRTLKRNLAYADVFDAMDELVTYRIDSSRKQSYLRLYMQIGRALTMDDIDSEAQRGVKNAILSKMEAEIARLKDAGKYDTIRTQLTGLPIGTLTFGYGDVVYTYNQDTDTLEVAEYDISRHFEQAGKILGEGLHTEYWTRHADEDHISVKIEVIVLVNDTDAMESLSEFAEDGFNKLYQANRSAIRHLPDTRKNVYTRMTQASPVPVAVTWSLPYSIDFSVQENMQEYERHLYCEDDGSFKTYLNPWEEGVIREELGKGIICWLRNLDRKSWSLSVPYEMNGEAKPMYPDLIVVRADAHGYVFDILEPHDPSRKDNYPKAVGLAKFAERHSELFGRIQLIRKMRGPDNKEHFYRLDMNDIAVTKKVRGVNSDSELDRIFDENAERED